MQEYEKPIILVNEDLAEGVYAASGSTTSGSACKSVYMLGVYHPMILHSDSDVNHTKSERGCEGCPANWGNGKCEVSQCNYNGNFKPSWEAAGNKPTDRW